MRHRVFAVFASAVVLICLIDRAGGDIVIDTFEQGPLFLSDSSLTPNPSLGQGPAQGLTEANVIKALRHTQVNHTAPEVDAAVIQLVLDQPDNGVELIKNASGVANYTLSYSGFFGFPSATNLNVDFSNEPGFLLAFDQVDYVIAATIRAQSNVPGAGGTYAATTTIDQPGTYFVAQGDFIMLGVGEPGEDDTLATPWSNVTNLRLTFNIASTDTGVVVLNDFRAGVPEPASAALLLLGATAVARRRR